MRPTFLLDEINEDVRRFADEQGLNNDPTQFRRNGSKSTGIYVQVQRYIPQSLRINEHFVNDNPKEVEENCSLESLRNDQIAKKGWQSH